MSRLLRYLLILVRSRKFLMSTSLILFMLFFVNLFINFTGNTESMVLRLIAHPLMSFTLLILAIDLMLLSGITRITPAKEERLHVGREAYVVLVVVSLLYAVPVYTEILLLGHTHYAPILLAASVAFYMLATEIYSIREGLILMYLPLLLAILITAHYIVFPSSFGNDTWRDAMWAGEVLVSGHYTGSRVFHEAYFVPSAVLLYTALGLVGRLSPVDASSVVGMLYLFALGTIFSVLARRIYGKVGSGELSLLLLLLYSTPMITLWSVWFIPQALALVFLLLLIWSLEAGDRRLQALSALAMVLTHPGVALFSLFFLAWLHLSGSGSNDVKSATLYLGILYTLYLVYTTVGYMVIPGLKLYIETFLSILVGEAAGPQTPAMQLGVANRLLPWIPIAVAVVLGFNTLLHSATRASERRWASVAVFSLAMLAAGYMITAVKPESTADRYIGLPAVSLLILASIPGLRMLSNKGPTGRAYIYMLASLLIASIAFSGTFTPSNPITANPSLYSVYGLLSYSERAEINTLSNMLDPTTPLTLYTDWRTGIIIIHDLIQKHDINVYSNLWIVQLGNLNLQLFGYYGYMYRGDLSFIHSNSILVLRVTSFTMIESWGRFKPELSYQYFNISKILDAGSVAIYAN